MKFKHIADNHIELDTKKYRVFYSYSTPVAYYHKEKNTLIVTDKKWSVTTTRHLNKYIKDNYSPEVTKMIVTQEAIDKIVANI